MADGSGIVAYRARRLLVGEVVRDGLWVSVRGDRVVALGDPADGARTVDLGEVILAPGFLNAHTHLELSHAPFCGDVASFPAFLWSMRDYRPRVDEAELGRAARDGACEALLTGTVAVIDLCTCAESAESLAASGLGGVLCSEVLGLHPARADSALARTLEILSFRRPGLRGGIFLHAPYSVSGELRSRARLFARQEGLLLATHLFESREEMALLTEGAGALQAAIEAMGMASHLPLVAPAVDVLHEHAPPGTLLVHLASMPPDLSPLIRGRVAVLCPRSNRCLGVGPAPYDALRHAGVTLALGTDSRASAPSLDMRDEMRAACDLYGIAPREAVLMATRNGAVAMGEGDLGGISLGSRASLVAIEDLRGDEAFGALLDPSAGVRQAWIDGRSAWVKS